MGYPTLTLQFDDAIAIIALTVPEKRNAVSSQMAADLLAALENVQESPARALIITGAGKSFCAGMDLDELYAMGRQNLSRNLEDSRRLAKLFYRLYGFPKPLIAAVNGAAIAGGCGIATMADFTLSVPGAKFGYPEVNIGFIPAIVSVFLRRQIGEKRTRELLLSARIFDADEAFRLGLVTEIVPPEALMARAREIACRLLAASPASLFRTKKLLIDYERIAIRADLEAAIEANADIRSTADFREGIAAFLEKRPPKWTRE